MIFYAGGRGLVKDREETIMIKLETSRMISFYRLEKGGFKYVIECLKSFKSLSRRQIER
jgi:hypothetical protein